MSNKLEIISQPGSFELDVKRFYVPGLVFKSECPKCSQVCHKDMADNYFQYPTTDTPIGITVYCEKCEHYWVAGHVLLKVTVELVEPKNEES